MTRPRTMTDRYSAQALDVMDLMTCPPEHGYARARLCPLCRRFAADYVSRGRHG